MFLLTVHFFLSLHFAVICTDSAYTTFQSLGKAVYSRAVVFSAKLSFATKLTDEFSKRLKGQLNRPKLWAIHCAPCHTVLHVEVSHSSL